LLCKGENELTKTKFKYDITLFYQYNKEGEIVNKNQKRRLDRTNLMDWYVKDMIRKKYPLLKYEEISEDQIQAQKEVVIISRVARLFNAVESGELSRKKGKVEFNKITKLAQKHSLSLSFLSETSENYAKKEHSK
jgi:hypothetical protein